MNAQESANNALLEKMTNAFLRWPLPETVCSDPCATKHGDKNRIGTNLLTAVEAKAMFKEVVLPLLAPSSPDLAVAQGADSEVVDRAYQLAARLETLATEVAGKADSLACLLNRNGEDYKRFVAAQSTSPVSPDRKGTEGDVFEGGPTYEALRKSLVECVAYLDRMGQDGVRERAHKALALPPDATSRPTPDDATAKLREAITGALGNWGSANRESVNKVLTAVLATLPAGGTEQGPTDSEMLDWLEDKKLKANLGSTWQIRPFQNGYFANEIPLTREAIRAAMQSTKGAARNEGDK